MWRSKSVQIDDKWVAVHKGEYDGFVTLVIEYTNEAGVTHSDNYQISPKSPEHFIGMVEDSGIEIALCENDCLRYWASKALHQAVSDNNKSVGW